MAKHNMAARAPAPSITTMIDQGACKPNSPSPTPTFQEDKGVPDDPPYGSTPIKVGQSGAQQGRAGDIGKRQATKSHELIANQPLVPFFTSEIRRLMVHWDFHFYVCVCVCVRVCRVQWRLHGRVSCATFFVAGRFDGSSLLCPGTRD